MSYCRCAFELTGKLASFHKLSRHALQLYRASLVPTNLTDEIPYWESPYPFCNVFFCGYGQRGSDWMIPLGGFAVKYGARVAELGVPADAPYQVLVDTAENTLPDWYTVGRQNTAWKTFRYIPTGWVNPSGSTGLLMREASWVWELTAGQHALGDFAVHQVAIALDKSAADVGKCANRPMNFVNMWDPSVTSNGFSGFAQRRYPNGTFAFSPHAAWSIPWGTRRKPKRSEKILGWEQQQQSSHSRRVGALVLKCEGYASS
ncbi:hypothetical protein B0H14DRAFT_3625084 [Mycena olivaceomarginata]|nr:hypothetical protein B0H14DRAFT_3625084 [Mycena olivaceomarginata]